MHFSRCLAALRSGLKYSRRKGMGPVPIYRTPTASTPGGDGFDPVEYGKARKLRHLLDQLTPVEEAPIHQIAPLMHLTRIAHGNMRVKGNTSCVWQQSKLHIVLPNAPPDIHYVYIVRDPHSSRPCMRSTRFRRRLVQDVLELSKECDVDRVWCVIDISRANLLMWPEDGDASRVPGAPVVQEVDENGDPVTDASDPEPGLGTRHPEGNQDGPAALQNDVHVEHEYKSLNSRSESSAANAANAELTVQTVHDLAHHLIHPDPNHPVGTRVGRNAVKYHQPQVLTTNGFVDMDKTPYAWARAFPTLFPPSYVLIDGKWQWAILHDITGWKRLRDAPLDFKEWSRFQLWRSDGRPAAHKTFKLAVHNHRVKKFAQSQGRQAVRTAGIDPNILIRDIQNAPDDSALRKATERVVDLAYHCSSNMVGSRGYMDAKYHEMKAINFCADYMEKKNYNIFHTLSQAEFHEYPLRRVLSSYISNLDIDTDLHRTMMVDDAKFALAVQSYPQVVTHFFAAKTELWLTLVMNPLFGVTEVGGAYENAGGRGAIHTHLLALSRHPAMKRVSEAVTLLAGQ